MDWVSNVTSNFFNKVLFNQPFIPGTVTTNYCAYNPNFPPKISGPANCPASSNRIGQFEDQLAISEANSMNDFNASVKNKELTITFHTENSAIATMKIIDLSGSLKKQNIITTGQQINVSDLQTGIYFVLVEQNNTLFKKKIFIE